MAPEQMQRKPCKESDQYALGVVVYQWLSGNLPFQGTVPEMMAQHIMSPPEPIPGISQQIQDVVFRALAKKPDERFENVTAFAQALERACRGSSPSERQEEASASRSRRNRDLERPEFASEKQELQKEVKAHCESGEQHRRAGRHQEALAELEPVFALDKNNTFALVSRGQTYQAMGKNKEALADYNKALALDSSLDWIKTTRDELRQRMSGKREK